MTSVPINDPLTAVRGYVEDRYRKYFEDDTWKLSDTRMRPSCPSWIWQSDDLRDTQSGGDATGGLLLDPEIGTCLYFVDYARQPKVRETIARALAIRQQLVPRQSEDTGDDDACGQWQVVVNWLVEDSAFPDWIGQTAEVRERTGHFEEIGVDAIVRDHRNWPDTCSAHGIPRMLLATRQLIAKRSAEDVDTWRSADVPVLDALKALPTQFDDPFTSQCARLTVETVLARLDANDPAAPKPTFPDLMSVKVQNFRNIDQLNLHFRSTGETVTSTVIQGPNGSGKSSVFEAISFALGGSSVRYSKYLADSNRKLLSRDDQYVQNYLQSKWSTERPSIRLNDQYDTSPMPTDQDTVRHNVQRLSSNLFSQECTKDFVTTPAQELAAEIASSFSNVAAETLDYLDGALRAAQERQRSFNADWGLRGNVVKRETVIEKIADVILNNELSALQGIAGWLGYETASPFAPLRSMSAISDGLISWQNSVSLVIKRLISVDTPELRRDRFLEFYQDGLAAKAPIKSFVEEIAGRTQAWSSDLERFIDRWGTWLEAKALAQPGQSADVEQAQASRSEITERLNAALSWGNTLRAQSESLSVAKSLMSTWPHDQSSTCPTCLSDVSPRSISEVIDDVVQTVELQLVRAREDYAAVKQALDENASQLARLGADEPPISYENQTELLSSVFWLLPDGANFENFVADPQTRAELIRLVQHFRRLPNVDFGTSDAPASAHSASERLDGALTDYARVAAAPVAWKEVNDLLQRQLAAITSSHLPQTVQSVWTELIHNMLPAPWQYPGRVAFRVVRNRAANQVTVVIEDKNQADALAAHILNGAETHNLGLAWFLTRYLTEGRFQLNALILDDPAQSMDQPTYRDFCRLMETMMRLHRLHKLPLSLVLLLHQDSRAVDAARATEGVLYQLRWNKRTPVSLKRLILHDDSAVSPKPKPQIPAATPRSFGG